MSLNLFITVNIVMEELIKATMINLWHISFFFSANASAFDTKSMEIKSRTVIDTDTRRAFFCIR